MRNLLKFWVKHESAKSRLKERLHRALLNQRGQGMVEYGLIIALVSVVVIVMLTGIGNSLLAKFTEINTNLQ